ncbi:MAG: hypothetical protein ACPGXZ_16320 [Saprospiraceae bacterium]
MTNIAKKETPNKVFKRLNKAFKGEIPLPIVNLLRQYTPYELYNALNYYHSSIDFNWCNTSSDTRSDNLTQLSRIHQTVCYLKECLLDIHSYNGIEYRLNEFIECSRERDYSLYLNYFIQYNSSDENTYLSTILALKEAFLKVVFSEIKDLEAISQGNISDVSTLEYQVAHLKQMIEYKDATIKNLEYNITIKNEQIAFLKKNKG